MNRIGVLTTVMLLASLAGCCCPNDYYVNRKAQAIDEASVDLIRRQPIEQAIIAQHTLYAYHFAEGKDVLNDLGRYDLKVLADHFCELGISVNVQRGSETMELYEARMRAVAKFLADAGVPANRVQIVQGLPGGPGLPSQWVVKILAKESPGTTVTPAAGTIAPLVGSGMSNQ